MTKMVGLAGWAGWDHVADLDLTIGDDDTGNQPLDQLPLLLPTGLFKPLAHALAELLHGQPKAHDFGLAIRLCLKLALLPGKGLLALLQVAPPPLIFRQAHHARKVGLGQSPLCQTSCRLNRIGTFGGVDIRKWLDTDKRIKIG